MKYYKQIKELCEFCESRNNDESVDFEEICAKCPRRKLCLKLFDLGDAIFGESPCKWDVDEMFQTIQELGEILGETE